MTGPEQPPPPDPWTLGPTPPQPQPQPPAPAPPGWPAAPYGQQPAYWPYVPQPARPRRRWLWWVIIAAVLTVGGCGAVIGTVGVRAYHAMDDAKAVANRFLSAVEQGDAGGAQDLLCGEAAPDLVQRVMSAGIVSHHVTGVQVQSGFGSRRSAGTTATVLVDVTDAAGQHPSDVEVVHELGVWLVCDVGRFGALPAR